MAQRKAACGVVHSDPGRAGWCVGRRKAASEYKALQGGGARDNIKSEQSNQDSFEEDLLDEDEDEDLVTATVTVGNGPGQLDRTTAATVLPAVAQQGDVYFY